MRKVGVAIGRFQVPYLHDGHRALLDFIYNNHDTKIVLLGVNTAMAYEREPLDYRTRQEMIFAHYPGMTIHPILDGGSDAYWSKQVDETICKLAGENADITLYGARDSFIPAYSGKHKTAILDFDLNHESGTELRAFACRYPRRNEDFRAGCIYAAVHRYPISFEAVDIVPYRRNSKTNWEYEVLLGQKASDENKFRFIGGFVDPTDMSLEAAALRELREEAVGIVVDTPRYVSSHRVEDRRYRKSNDKVMTALFVAKHFKGDPKAGDDIINVEWKPLMGLKKHLIPNHVELGVSLFNYLLQGQFDE